MIDLPPGEWIAAGTYFSRPPVVLEITGELPDDLPEPESTVTFALRRMPIENTAGAPVAGGNLLRIEHLGAQPHVVAIVKVLDGTTAEDAAAWLDADRPGTPVADLNVELVKTTPDQSGGVTQWVTVALEPGTCKALCFVPEPERGMPHAFMGMHMLVEVAQLAAIAPHTRKHVDAYTRRLSENYVDTRMSSHSRTGMIVVVAAIGAVRRRARLVDRLTGEKH